MTVRDSILRFALRVDPKDKNGVTFSNATIGSSDGDKFPKQRLLDMYNDARWLLFQELQSRLSETELLNAISQTIVDTSLTFSGGAASKPAGYVKHISLFDSVKAQIYIVDASYAETIRRGSLPAFVETTANRYVVDIGSQFKSMSGTTYIPNASTYLFTYFGLPIYALGDVTGGTVIESYNDNFNPTLLDLGERLASDQGYNTLPKASNG